MATSNQQRAALECARATGIPYQYARRLADAGLITRVQPVPDAATNAQHALEALAVYGLTERLRDKQLDGAVFGFTTAIPRPDGLDLITHPQMLDAVLAALLPYSRPQEREYVCGVPGLRPRHTGQCLVLEQIGTGASLRILNATAQKWIPDYQNGEIAIWRKHPDRLLNSEKRTLSSWDRGYRHANPEGRDLLFSRFLRRPGMLREIGKDHGDVNSYTHDYEDIVLEWCCGPNEEEFAEDLRRSGIEAKPSGTDFAPTKYWSRHVIEIGTGMVTLRQNCLCDGIDACTGCRRRQEMRLGRLKRVTGSR